VVVYGLLRCRVEQNEQLRLVLLELLCKLVMGPTGLEPMKHPQLMTQGDDLGLHYGSAPKTDKKGIEQHLM
jgi:hypothetical protein